jgi:hypothetical protein
VCQLSLNETAATMMYNAGVVPILLELVAAKDANLQVHSLSTGFVAFGIWVNPSGQW